MFKFVLNTRECISCAVCVDLCSPVALSMKAYSGKTIEGKTQIKSNEFDNLKVFEENKLSFPYFSSPIECNGCMVCVNECPVNAIEIKILRE
jgi:NAD-dependent dihydropyrimidine dehydrogenase PreA subunit